MPHACCSTDYGASVAEAETLIEEFKAFQEQRRTFLAVVTTLEGWATGDGMEAHRDHSAAIARIAELRAKIAAMDEAGAAYSGALAQSLEALQALVEQAKAYNAKVRSMQRWSRSMQRWSLVWASAAVLALTPSLGPGVHGDVRAEHCLLVCCR